MSSEMESRATVSLVVDEMIRRLAIRPRVIAKHEGGGWSVLVSGEPGVGVTVWLQGERSRDLVALARDLEELAREWAD